MKTQISREYAYKKYYNWNFAKHPGCNRISLENGILKIEYQNLTVIQSFNPSEKRARNRFEKLHLAAKINQFFDDPKPITNYHLIPRKLLRRYYSELKFQAFIDFCTSHSK